MRTLALVVFAACSIAGTAHAQTAILVDKEALTKKLQQYRQQIATLQAQLGLPRGPAGGPVAAQLAQFDDQVKSLERDITSLPAAPAACAAPLQPAAPRYQTPPPAYPQQPGYPPPQGYPPAQAYPPPQGYPPSQPGYPPPQGYPRGDDYERRREHHHGEEAGHGPNAMPLIDDPSLESLADAVEAESFSQDKIRVLQEGAASRWFRVAHVERLLPLFTFSQDKLRALEILAPRIVDRENSFRIYNLFTFSADKERARKILGR